jgi:DNA-binding GntR family transcriptional regulator
MTVKAPLNLKPLKEQVYDYLREQFRLRQLVPGEAINLESTSRRLGVSRTPLRDALILLEAEGFVTISPRRGITVNQLSLRDIEQSYQVLGSLEGTALHLAAPRLGGAPVEAMKQLNEEMASAVAVGDFDKFYSCNLTFHDTYLSLSGNEILQHMTANLKRRLYEVPRPPQWIREWEERSVGEHARLVELIEADKIDAAAAFIRDVHWSFAVQEPFIRQFYSSSIEPMPTIEAPAAASKTAR